MYEEKFAIMEKSVQRKREFHYDATCRKIAQKNAEENLDSFLVTSPYNLRYLTNFTGTTGLAVITLEKAFLLLIFVIPSRRQRRLKGLKLLKMSDLFLMR